MARTGFVFGVVFPPDLLAEWVATLALAFNDLPALDRVPLPLRTRAGRA